MNQIQRQSYGSHSTLIYDGQYKVKDAVKTKKTDHELRNI